jgi:hypothetical protein
MSLPSLIDPVTAAALAANEERLCDIARSMVEMMGDAADLDGPAAAAADLLTAVILCNELLWAHESGSPSDADLHHAAHQLKLWHLLQLDNLITPL